MNTGYKGWTILEQYVRATGAPTGQTKINSSSDPDYIAPIQDETACPLFTYMATNSQFFTKNNCASGQIGSSVLFSKTYTSTISQADADHKAMTDGNYNAEGQAYANTHGTCTVGSPHTVFVSLITPGSQSGSSNVYRFSAYQNQTLAETITVWLEFQYTNMLNQTAYTTIVKTIPAGQIEDQGTTWDISDGAPIGNNNMEILSYYSSPLENSIVSTPSGPKVLKLQFEF